MKKHRLPQGRVPAQDSSESGPGPAFARELGELGNQHTISLGQKARDRRHFGSRLGDAALAQHPFQRHDPDHGIARRAPARFKYEAPPIGFVTSAERVHAGEEEGSLASGNSLMASIARLVTAFSEGVCLVWNSRRARLTAIRGSPGTNAVAASGLRVASASPAAARKHHQPTKTAPPVSRTILGSCFQSNALRRAPRLRVFTMCD
jgi:hypothetical protein